MLEVDYSSRLGELINSVPWEIELPSDWLDFFKQDGVSAAFGDDDRHNRRQVVRTHGVLWFEKPLPFHPRPQDPMGVYTRDFSRHGVGLVSPIEVYPEEQLRIALPTFWLQVRAVRARRIASRCFEIGTELIHHHAPDVNALDVCAAIET